MGTGIHLRSLLHVYTAQSCRQCTYCLSRRRSAMAFSLSEAYIQAYFNFEYISNVMTLLPYLHCEKYVCLIRMSMLK